MMTSYADPISLHTGGDGVNPLQRVIAEAMTREGIPLEKRGSRAELARRMSIALRDEPGDPDQRIRTLQTIIGYIFNGHRDNENYLPDEKHRAALAKALKIPLRDINDAGSAIKGLRVYSSGPDVLQQAQDLRATLVLGEAELSDAQLKRMRKMLADLAAEVDERLGEGSPKS